MSQEVAVVKKESQGKGQFKVFTRKIPGEYTFHFDVPTGSYWYRIEKLIKENWQDRDHKIATILRDWFAKEGLIWDMLPAKLKLLVPDLKPKDK